MGLPWAPQLDRTQLIRGAAKLLAYQYQLVASRPHEWRIHILARELLAELHAQGYPVHADVVLFRDTLRHYDMDRQEFTREEPRTWVGHAHIGADNKTPCIHIREGESSKCTTKNLLLDGSFWLRPEAHDRLAQFLRLDGAACSRNPLGPWQDHDLPRSATLRGAMAAFGCKLTYDETLFHHGPLLTVGRMWQVGRSLQETFIKPWQRRFETYLNQVATIPLDDDKKGTWKFNRGETHWTLKLCWAIVKEAHDMRLDCPPQVVALEVLQNRGELGLQAALLRYLVDDPTGPQVRATAAAHMLSLPEHAVHEMLSVTRKTHPRPDHEQPELWDPFPESTSILVPMAMTSPSGRTSGDDGRDDTSPSGGDS
jgi:hypothetical protein